MKTQQLQLVIVVTCSAIAFNASPRMHTHSAKLWRPSGTPTSAAQLSPFIYYLVRCNLSVLGPLPRYERRFFRHVRKIPIDKLALCKPAHQNLRGPPPRSSPSSKRPLPTVAHSDYSLLDTSKQSDMRCTAVMQLKKQIKRSNADHD